MPEGRVTVEVLGVFAEDGEGGLVHHFAVFQDEAQRKMRVYIGRCEAQALSLVLSGFAPERPQTYEAMRACLSVAGVTVEEAEISDLREETFYAWVRLRSSEREHLVDMRPGDALNLVVRYGCPLFVNEAVFRSRQPKDEASAVTMAAEEHAALPITGSSDERPQLSPPEISEELARLFSQDQSDRTSPPTGRIDWNAVAPRDAARLARVKELCRSQSLQTGMDHFHAAMILQHGHAPEDYLLSHELCIIALSKGIEQAKWLAAASEDRYLMNTGRPQRFGTQYGTDGSDGQWRLYDVQPDVSDALRRAFNVPALAEAEAHAQRMNAKPEAPDAIR